MSWLHEMELEFRGHHREVRLQPALLRLIESWSAPRAMKSGGSRMMIENSLAGSSKSTRIVERAIQSAQGMIRTVPSAIDGTRDVKFDATHSVWPWIAEQAGFLLTRCEVGRRKNMRMSD